MFFWTDRTAPGLEPGLEPGPGAGPEREPLPGPGNTQSAILRTLILDRLSSAARDILAVVDRTVAGLEDEVAGYRREAARWRGGVASEAGGHDDVVVVSEDEEEKGAEPPGSGAEDPDILDFLWFDDEDETKDPDYQVPPRSCGSAGVRGDRRRPGRPRLSDSLDHVDLRICVLEDSNTDLLSKTVFRRSPVQTLRCPRGLSESDFLVLLRSSFPRLASGERFDVFRSDRSRRLQPLMVAVLTPEEVCRSLQTTGARNPVLYIRLKNSKNLQTDDDGDNGSASTSHSTRLSSLSDKRRRGRPRLGEEPTHHLLRLCLLDDSPSDVLSKTAFLKSPVRELKVARGLREEDFLAQLRAAFPQLAEHDQTFDLFKADRRRRLQRLEVDNLTPEGICRTMKATGVDKSLIYIRLKSEEKKDKNPEAPPTEESPPPGGQSETSRQSSTPTDEGPSHSGPLLKEAREVKDEGESSGGGASDWKPRAVQRRGGTEQEGRGQMSCQVCGVGYRNRASLIKHAWTHADEPHHRCGVCGERMESGEELKGHVRAHGVLHGGLRPFTCSVCGKTFARQSGLSVHRWVHVAERPHRCDVCPRSFGLKAQLRAHRRSHAPRDAHVCSICGKAVCDLRSLARHRLTHSGERRFGCEECGKHFTLACTLRAHLKTHTARERRFLCHVCCKTFLTAGGLAAHVRTHTGERPHACVVCSKAFYTAAELRAHTRVHTGEAPYGCSHCGRFFKRQTHLSSHQRTHLGIKRFLCSVCGKACARREHLTVHMRTHSGERPYRCTVCSRAFTQSHCLKTHMKAHAAPHAAPHAAAAETDTKHSPSSS